MSRNNVGWIEQSGRISAKKLSFVRVKWPTAIGNQRITGHYRDFWGKEEVTVKRSVKETWRERNRTKQQKQKTLGREGRAAAHQAGHCQQLPHQRYHLCREQAEPSLVGWVLWAHCTSLIGVWHGETCMKGYGCDLMGGFLTSTHVGGSQGVGWVQVESHSSTHPAEESASRGTQHSPVRRCTSAAHMACFCGGGVHITVYSIRPSGD